MFRAFQAYVSQERHQVTRSIPVNAFSEAHYVDVIELFKYPRARRVHRAHDSPPEVRQPFENIDAVDRGEIVQSADGTKQKEKSSSFAMTIRERCLHDTSLLKMH